MIPEAAGEPPLARVFFASDGLEQIDCLTVPARRTRHVRFNDLYDPAPIPRATDYSSVISSDIAIVVRQHPP